MFNRAKYFSIAAALFLVVSQIAFASESEDLMKQGNQFYQDKQYEKAIDTYQKIITMGYVGTSLYYNLGNSYYRDGKIGYAILYYEKALELSPGDDDVIHNLAIANLKTVDKIDTLPKFFLFQWWETVLAMFPVSGWTLVVYLFYLLLLCSIGLYFFARGLNIQRYSVFAGMISALFLIAAATLWIVSLNREFTVKNAVVVEPTAAVKLAPDSTSNDAFVIHEGLKVRELDHVGSWVKIRLQDGKEGWIEGNEIGTI
jgi:tetratricopeptide (TPR) repeat protein